MKLLLVEDQENTSLLLEGAIAAVLPKYVPGFTGYPVARWYTQAEQMIRDIQYDWIILDHRIPEHDPRFSDIKDGAAYSEKLDEAQDRGIGGYGLISLIRERNPSAIIIGTSSLGSGLDRFPRPDYTINKLEAERELEEVIQKIVLRKVLPPPV